MAKEPLVHDLTKKTTTVGDYSDISSSYCLALGSKAKAIGYACIAIGDNVEVRGAFQIKIGKTAVLESMSEETVRQTIAALQQLKLKYMLLEKEHIAPKDFANQAELAVNTGINIIVEQYKVDAKTEKDMNDVKIETDGPKSKVAKGKQKRTAIQKSDSQKDESASSEKD